MESPGRRAAADDVGARTSARSSGRSWTNYTYSLKARKLGGAEGFLILFRVGDENAKSWWNLGGWGNTRHAIEMGGIIGNEVNGSVETGRWYHIRVEVQDRQVRCFLDGKLIHDARAPTVRALYASAARTGATGEVILKVVNAASEALETEIEFAGTKAVREPATFIVLSSSHSTDENSLEAPRKVAPVTTTRSLPAHALLTAFRATPSR